MSDQEGTESDKEGQQLFVKPRNASEGSESLGLKLADEMTEENVGEKVEKSLPQHDAVEAVVEPVPVLLTEELIGESLCNIRKTINGLGFAPAKFICNDKLLSEVDPLRKFAHLRYINVAFNKITDISPLMLIPYLLQLIAASNKITKLSQGTWPMLAQMDLSNNEITELSQTSMPRMKILSLRRNKLQTLSDPLTGKRCFTDTNFPNLHTLDLASNQLGLPAIVLGDTPRPPGLGFDLPSLQALYLADNSFTTLGYFQSQTVPSETNTNEEEVIAASSTVDAVEEQTAKPEEASVCISVLGHLPNLSVLNIRKNQLRDLNGISVDAVPNLQYLNLRQNLLSQLQEFSKLNSLSFLRTILLVGNPVTEEKDFRLEMSVRLRNLRRLDKEEFLEGELEEAQAIAEQREAEMFAIKELANEDE